MLENKVALVTGAGRGIGRAIAIALAKEGAEVVVNYNGSEERAKEVKQTIEENGGKASIYKCNVSDFEACEAMIKDIVKEHGRLDILINNAGITKDGLIMKRTIRRLSKGMQKQVAVTSISFAKPSVEDRQIQRTTPFPMCWATSITQVFPPFSTVSASFIIGSFPGNSTSITGPMTCTIFPFSISSFLSDGGRQNAADFTYMIFLPEPKPRPVPAQFASNRKPLSYRAEPLAPPTTSVISCVIAA